ncbi:hypothetical protein HII31_04838 [Pseudocercospora fuligena]|uniref:Uncharacterized protein n=1 Tax=Pseudocercospora fuligena TaxID=685502 RepID=A0A8H6VMP1_9PEZI|nr:hypothetical protein HII31_04838 [Pseudocercospora fuligena]
MVQFVREDTVLSSKQRSKEYRKLTKYVYPVYVTHRGRNISLTQLYPLHEWKQRYKDLQVRLDRGLLAYEAYSLSELRRFAHEKCRRITTFPDDKLSLIQLLEEADEDMKFPLMDLPPELRCKIYEFSVASLNIPSKPTQPPITKICRIVRREALPIFNDHVSDTFQRT